MRRNSIQTKFRQKYHETGYTANQISNALSTFNIEYYTQTQILNFAKENEIAIDLVKEGIITKRRGTGYLIQKSKLIEIVEGLNILITEQELKEEIKDQTFLTNC